MFDIDATAVAMEVKFAPNAEPGEFDGYGAVFNHLDAHGDVIEPGAFADSLAKRTAEGRSLPMYAEHGPYVGGDHLPVGVWKNVAEDSHGLKASGLITGMDTDYGKRIHSLVKSGALGGLSIEFHVPPGGAVMGKSASEPKRTIKKLDIKGISLVADPSNSRSRVMDIKSAAMLAGDRDKASAAVAAAMRLHDKSMAGESYSYANPKDKAVLMNHLRDAHEVLTGSRAPDGMDGWKSAPTIREFEQFIRESGFSRSEATQLAERVFKSAPSGEEADQAAVQTSVKSALDAFHAVALGFPKTQS